MVSVGGITRQSRRIAEVGALVTAPAYTRRRYATAVTEAITRRVLERGQMAAYLCLSDNEPSKRICLGLGYHYVTTLIGFTVMVSGRR